jgi:transposase
MPRTHPPYAPEYRRRIIELARSGRPIAQLAREFEASANAIRKWVKQTGLDEGLRSDGLTTAEREELNRLRRENRVLREEREILAKAAAWFATETCGSSQLDPRELVDGFDGLAVACKRWGPRQAHHSRRPQAANREPSLRCCWSRSRCAIKSPCSSVAELVADAFACGIDCFGFCSRVGGRNGATA